MSADRRNRVFRYALVASLALHALLFLSVPDFFDRAQRAAASVPPIIARLMAPEPVVAPAEPPAVKPPPPEQPKKKPAPPAVMAKPVPAPVPAPARAGTGPGAAAGRRCTGSTSLSPSSLRSAFGSGPGAAWARRVEPARARRAIRRALSHGAHRGARAHDQGQLPAAGARQQLGGRRAARRGGAGERQRVDQREAQLALPGARRRRGGDLAARRCRRCRCRRRCAGAKRRSRT